MDKKEFNLDFCEAIKIIVNGGAVRGERFVSGIYLKMNRFEQLVTVDVPRVSAEELYVNIRSLATQKYREVTIFTVRNLSE